jgi:hypothetical protein
MPLLLLVKIVWFKWNDLFISLGVSKLNYTGWEKIFNFVIFKT